MDTWEDNGPGLWDIEPTAGRIRVQLSLPGGGDHYPAHCPANATSYKFTYRASWMNLIESKPRLVLPLEQSIFPAAKYNLSLYKSNNQCPADRNWWSLLWWAPTATPGALLDTSVRAGAGSCSHCACHIGLTCVTGCCYMLKWCITRQNFPRIIHFKCLFSLMYSENCPKNQHSW